jgi:ribosomal protein S18 acetylase RimI-like enzyme
MDPLHFRLATEADIDAVVRLVTRAYRGDASRQGWTTEADLLDGERIDPGVLRADIARPRSRIVLGLRGDALLACAHVADDGGQGYFGMFAVEPTRQGGGIGRAVVAECERIARDDWRLPRMCMTVIEQRTELIAWYERLGYRRTGEHRPFPYGDARFGSPRRDDLRFEVLEKPLWT